VKENTDGLEIKISDFGLARRFFGQGSYYITNPDNLPLRWYGTEVITQGKYTKKVTNLL
jgi:hypothetical protein